MRTDVLALAAELSLGQADAEQLVLAYDRLRLVRAQSSQLLSSLSLLDVTAGAGTYTLPTTAGVPIAFFYGERELPIVPRALAATCYGTDWALHEGDPEAVIEDRESRRSFRLYPVPIQTSAGWVPNYGEPLGRDFPGGMLAVLHTDAPENAPAWLDLPLALGVLALEAENESSHKDAIFAAKARNLAELLERMLG